MLWIIICVAASMGLYHISAELIKEIINKEDHSDSRISGVLLTGVMVFSLIRIFAD
ncbi:hypothetical protein [Sporosalibacterium faouarense]|uniref:hypothetical protein n=1 Tax=Sporosalibacterium faouarense TaxID=516123 RepID=UPI00192BE626|nr:hypothetical protein [Sporosalibacterium faouarense]